MHHFVAHSAKGRLLFHSWEEACHLWRLLLRHCPAPRSLCVMPNHVHLVHRCSAAADFHVARRAYAQWLSRRRGGAHVWHRAPAAEALQDRAKLARNVRYVHLNPCRERLVADPLSWPLSTHLDVVGLAVPGVRKPHSDPIAFHHYVSGDPTVHVNGTELPVASIDAPRLEDLLDAVSAATRTPAPDVLGVRGAPRTLFLRAARSLTTHRLAVIASFVGVCTKTVSRTPSTSTAAVERIGRLAADRRIVGLHDRTLPLVCRKAARRDLG